MDNKNIARFFQILMVLSGISAFIGWYIYDGLTPVDTAIWSSLYKTIQTFVLETGFDEMPVPLILKIAVYMAPLSLAGALIYALFRSVQEHLVTLSFRYWHKSHIIVVGSINFCIEILQGKIRNESSKIPMLFLLPTDSKDTLPPIFSKYPVVFGESSDILSWKKCGVWNADSAIVSLDSPDEMSIVRKHVEYLKDSRKKKKFSLYFALGTMNQVRFFSQSTLFKDDDHFIVEGFNFQHEAAIQAVERFAPHLFVPRNELESIPQHLVIDGFTEYAQWIIVEASQLYHYPSLKKLQITLICEDLNPVNKFLELYHGIKEVVDFNVITKNESNNDFKQANCKILPEDSPNPYGIFLFPNDPWEIPELLRQWRRYLHLQHSEAAYPTALKVFLPSGMLYPDFLKTQLNHYHELNFTVHSISDFIDIDWFLDNQETLDAIAKQIHEMYVRRYNAPTWNNLTDAMKEANRRSARHLKIKLNLAGYSLNDKSSSDSQKIPDFSTEQIHMFSQVEHRRWSAEKILEGYIPGEPANSPKEDKYQKNILYIHKDIRPFSELNEQDISKDVETFKDLKEILSHVMKFKSLIPFKQKTIKEL